MSSGLKCVLTRQEQSFTFLQCKCKNAVNFCRRFLPIRSSWPFHWLCPSSPCRFVFEVFLDLSRFCYGIYNLIKLHFISNNLGHLSSLIELHWRNFKENYHRTALSAFGSRTAGSTEMAGLCQCEKRIPSMLQNSFGVLEEVRSQLWKSTARLCCLQQLLDIVKKPNQTEKEH